MKTSTEVLLFLCHGMDFSEVYPRLLVVATDLHQRLDFIAII